MGGDGEEWAAEGTHLSPELREGGDPRVERSEGVRSQTPREAERLLREGDFRPEGCPSLGAAGRRLVRSPGGIRGTAAARAGKLLVGLRLRGRERPASGTIPLPRRHPMGPTRREPAEAPQLVAPPRKKNPSPPALFSECTSKRLF